MSKTLRIPPLHRDDFIKFVGQKHGEHNEKFMLEELGRNCKCKLFEVLNNYYNDEAIFEEVLEQYMESDGDIVAWKDYCKEHNLDLPYKPIVIHLKVAVVLNPNANPDEVIDKMYYTFGHKDIISHKVLEYEEIKEK